MTRPENDPPDFAALARQYLDLWEDQLAAMAANPELAEQTSRFFDAMGRFGAAANPMAAASLAELVRHMGQAQGAGADEPGAQARAQAASGPSGDGDRGLDELARRLDDLEERLARLEPGAARTGDSPGGSAGKRDGKSAATKKRSGSKRQRPAGQ